MYINYGTIEDDSRGHGLAPCHTWTIYGGKIPKISEKNDFALRDLPATSLKAIELDQANGKKTESNDDEPITKRSATPIACSRAANSLIFP